MAEHELKSGFKSHPRHAGRQRRRWVGVKTLGTRTDPGPCAEHTRA